MKNLIKAIVNLPKAPCDGCQYFNMCRHGFSCKSFLSYVRSGKYNDEIKKIPTRAWYVKLMNDEGE